MERMPARSIKKRPNGYATLPPPERAGALCLPLDSLEASLGFIEPGLGERLLSLRQELVNLSDILFRQRPLPCEGSLLDLGRTPRPDDGRG